MMYILAQAKYLRIIFIYFFKERKFSKVIIFKKNHNKEEGVRS